MYIANKLMTEFPTKSKLRVSIILEIIRSLTNIQQNKIFI